MRIKEGYFVRIHIEIVQNLDFNAGEEAWVKGVIKNEWYTKP